MTVHNEEIAALADEVVRDMHSILRNQWDKDCLKAKVEGVLWRTTRLSTTSPGDVVPQAKTVIDQLEQIEPRLKDDVVSSFAVGCAIEALKALSAPASPCVVKKSPEPLVVGAVYETRNGPATYKGIDVFHGETTHRFEEPNNRRDRYIKPEALADYLPKSAASLPSARDVREAFERIIKCYERNVGRQSEKLDDIPRIARSALSNLDAAAPAAGGDARQIAVETALRNGATIHPRVAALKAATPPLQAPAHSDALREALKPFAAIADLYADAEDDTFRLVTDMDLDAIRLLTLGACRKARAALTAPAAKAPAVSEADVGRDSLDARRYRWLRNPKTDVALVLDKVTGESPRGVHEEFRGYDYEYRAGAELDAAIDEAMGQSGGGTKAFDERSEFEKAWATRPWRSGEVSDKDVAFGWRMRAIQSAAQGGGTEGGEA